MPEARTAFHGASQVVAQVALEALLPMLTHTRSSTIEAELLEGSMLTNATSNTVSTSKLILAMLANSFAVTVFAAILFLAMLAERCATTLLAFVLPLSMRADRGAATLNTTRAPLQMHTIDIRHLMSHAGTQGTELDKHTPLLEQETLMSYR